MPPSPSCTIWKNGKIYVTAPPSQLTHVIDIAIWTEINAFNCPQITRVSPGLTRRRHYVGCRRLRWHRLSARRRGRPRVGSHPLKAPIEIHGLTIHEDVLWACGAATRGVRQLYLD